MKKDWKHFYGLIFLVIVTIWTAPVAAEPVSVARAVNYQVNGWKVSCGGLFNDLDFCKATKSFKPLNIALESRDDSFRIEVLGGCDGQKSSSIAEISDLGFSGDYLIDDAVKKVSELAADRVKQCVKRGLSESSLFDIEEILILISAVARSS